MWTITYKGFWIHGYVDKDECRIQATLANGTNVWNAKSLLAAKQKVSRMIKAGTKPVL